MKKFRFFIYATTDNEFIKIKKLQAHRVSNIDKASYWTDLGEAKSWRWHVKDRFPGTKLKGAKLSIN